MVSVFIYILSALLILSPIAIDAENSIARSYELIAGGGSCAMKIMVQDEGPMIPANKIIADEAVCSGSPLLLNKLTTGDSDSLMNALATIAEAANIHFANLDQNLTCGVFVVPKYTDIYMAAPSLGDIQLPQPISAIASELDLGDTFTLIDGNAYIIVGTSCMYMSTDVMNEENMSEEDLSEEAMASDSPMEATCFPADATVTLAGGETRRMDELSIGDEVHVGNGKTSHIFAWTHWDAKYKSNSYVRIIAGDKTLTVTPTHFVYLNGRTVAAENVKKGDVLFGADEDEHLQVSNVSRVAATGLYNPQTTHGDIVVDGFLVTTYTTAIRPNAAHAFLAPLRAGYSAISSMLSFGVFSE